MNIAIKNTDARDSILEAEKLLKDNLEAVEKAGYQTDFTDNVTLIMLRVCMVESLG